MEPEFNRTNPFGMLEDELDLNINLNASEGRGEEGKAEIGAPIDEDKVYLPFPDQEWIFEQILPSGEGEEEEENKNYCFLCVKRNSRNDEADRKITVMKNMCLDAIKTDVQTVVQDVHEYYEKYIKIYNENKEWSFKSIYEHIMIHLKNHQIMAGENTRNAYRMLTWALSESTYKTENGKRKLATDKIKDILILKKSLQESIYLETRLSSKNVKS